MVHDISEGKEVIEAQKTYRPHFADRSQYVSSLVYQKAA